MQELVDESLCLFHDLASHSRIAKGDSSAALEYQTDTPSTSLNEKTVDIQKISVYEKIDSSPSIQPSFSRDLVQKLYTMRASYYLLLFNVIVILLKFLVKPNDNFVSRLALPPGRFFQRSSMKYLVDDYMGMNVPPSQLHSTDIVIVMYYASWSLKSRALRPVFEQVARQFTGRSDLAFVATNCFTRLGKCRESYKLYSFPIIIAYIGNSQVMYTGELAMDYIIRWILHIRTPMIRLSKRHEILDFFLAHDNAVVAFFPVESVLKKTWRYQQFMLASILMSQYDQTMSSVGFAVLTDHFEALNLLDITAESQIHLHSFNHSSTYPNEHDYNGSAIAAWVHANSKAPEIEWISSESWNLGKTEQLYHILNSGPTVITFTQRDVLNVASSDLNIVKQVVMEYLDCNSPKKGLHVSSARSAALTYKAETYLNHFMFPSIRLYNVLRNLSHPMQDQLHQCCLLSVASLEQICNQCAVPRRGLVNSEMCTNWRFHKHHKSFPLLNFSACRKLAQVKTKDEIMTDCCMWMQNADLIDFLMPERSSCKWPGFGYCPRLNYGHSIRSHNSKEESIYGLSCSTNNSLRFAAVDIRHHDHLLRKLNLSSSTPTMNTSIVIVDAKAETVHLMQSQLSG
ncbi:hypothetical protein AB6A40_004319 [Gnathostoma spinigerum]|uniref:Thioredoxin domain-containing protein n=1 Tax=Gnathostoma spinigerum TaxID=75299 RepID=A0ABD6EMU8_9BILA